MAHASDKKKRYALNTAKILVSFVLVYFLLRRIGLEKIWQQLSDANWLFVALGIATFSASNLLGSLQWLLLLRSQNVKISIGHAVSYYHVGLFFNNFLIGYVGGDAFRMYDISRYCGDSTAAVSSVIFDRLIGFFMLTFIAMTMSLVWVKDLASIGTVFFIAAILGAWSIVLFLLFHERAGRALGRLFKPLLPAFLSDKLLEVYLAVNHYRQKRKTLLLVIVISFAVQALRILTHYWAARAVGSRIDLFYFGIFIPIVALFASLPISFGGIGVREQSGMTLFTAIGASASKVVAFEFLAYLIGILAAIPGGLIFALRKETKMEVIELREHMDDSPLNEEG